MTEKELIFKIRQLKRIEPSSDWVILVKKELFSQDQELRRTLFSRIAASLNYSKLLLRGVSLKPVLVTLSLLLFVFGLSVFAENALPGDTLYPIKKLVEKSQGVFVPTKELPKRTIEIANRRLDDVAKAAKDHPTKNLAPALDEFQTSLSQAAKTLKLETNKSAKGQLREIVREVKKLEEKSEQVKTLGVEISADGELDNALANLVAAELKGLEKSLLTESQQKVLEEARLAEQAGDYTGALEKILLLNSGIDRD